MIDLSVYGECDDDDCLFCKKEVGVKVVIWFVDELGDFFVVDVCELFGIDVGDVVVINGIGKVVLGFEMM